MSVKYARAHLLGWLFMMTIGLVSAHAADVYLSISRGGGQRLRLAIPDFTRAEGSSAVNGGLGHEMARILADDLRIYRFFDLIDNQKFLQEAGQADAQAGAIVFKQWAELGAQALVKGTYSQEGGDLIVECRLFDVGGRA
jgi:hypothetical protein